MVVAAVASMCHVTWPWFQGDGANQDVTVHWRSERCSSTNVEAWLAAVCGYKGPLLVSVASGKDVVTVSTAVRRLCE